MPLELAGRVLPELGRIPPAWFAINDCQVGDRTAASYQPRTELTHRSVYLMCHKWKGVPGLPCQIEMASVWRAFEAASWATTR